MSTTDTGFRERRHSHWRIQEIGVMAMLLVQLAGLIWGAAMLKSGVDHTRLVVADLKVIVNSVDHAQRDLEIEQARQSGRIDAIQSMLVEIQRQRQGR